MANKKQKVTIYWNTRHIKLEDIPEVKRRIRERFGIPNHTTVNGETDCYIREEEYGIASGNGKTWLHSNT